MSDVSKAEWKFVSLVAVALSVELVGCAPTLSPLRGESLDAREEHDAFARFVAVYPPDVALGSGSWTELDTMAMVGQDVPDFTRFQREYARPSMGRGLIRFIGRHDVGSRGLATDDWNGPNGWRTSWPKRERLVVFAYDWLGRQYAFDTARTNGTGEPLISLLDPEDRSVFESEMAFRNFLDALAGELGPGLLETALFAEWRAAKGSVPGPRQCVSYKQPLLLGGKREIGNLHLGDMDVYLTIMAQIRERVGGS